MKRNYSQQQIAPQMQMAAFTQDQATLQNTNNLQDFKQFKNQMMGQGVTNLKSHNSKIKLQQPCNSAQNPSLPQNQLMMTQNTMFNNTGDNSLTPQLNQQLPHHQHYNSISMGVHLNNQNIMTEQSSSQLNHNHLCYIRNYYANIKMNKQHNQGGEIQQMVFNQEGKGEQIQQNPLINIQNNHYQNFSIQNHGYSNSVTDQAQIQRSQSHLQLQTPINILNEMQDISFKIQNIFDERKQPGNFQAPKSNQMGSTCTPQLDLNYQTFKMMPSASHSVLQTSLNQSLVSPMTSNNFDPQNFNQVQILPRINQSKKKAMPQLPKSLSQIRLLNPIVEQAITMQQERKRSRSKRNARNNNSQQSIKEEPEEEMRETFRSDQKFLSTQHGFKPIQDHHEIEQTPCFKSNPNETAIKTLRKSNSQFSKVISQIKDEQTQKQIQSLIETQKKRENEQQSSHQQFRVLSTACSTQDSSTVKEPRIQKFKIPKVMSKKIFERPDSCMVAPHPFTATDQTNDRLQSRGGSRTASLQGSNEKKFRYHIEDMSAEQNQTPVETPLNNQEKDMQFQTLQDFFNAKSDKQQVKNLKLQETPDELQNLKLKKVKTRNLRRGLQSYDKCSKEDSIEVSNQQQQSLRQSMQQINGQEQFQTQENLLYDKNQKKRRNKSQNQSQQKDQLINQYEQKITKNSSKKRYGSIINTFEPYQNQALDFNKTHKLVINDQQTCNTQENQTTLKLPDIQSPKNNFTLSFKPNKQLQNTKRGLLSREVSPALQNPKVVYEKPQYKDIEKPKQFIDKVISNSSTQSTQNIFHSQSQSLLDPFVPSRNPSFLGNIQSHRNILNSQRSNNHDSIEKPPSNYSQNTGSNQSNTRQKGNSSIMMNATISKRQTLLSMNPSQSSSILTLPSSQGSNSSRNDMKLQIPQNLPIKSTMNSQNIEVLQNITFGMFKGMETQKNIDQTNKIGSSISGIPQQQSQPKSTMKDKVYNNSSYNNIPQKVQSRIQQQLNSKNQQISQNASNSNLQLL
eukprot:403333477